MLYTIGDTHLSLSCQKPMDIFGGRWEGYMDKLREGLSVLTEEDTLVLCGDISWGMELEEAREDFRFLDSLPGKKILLKGNHDYWWTSMKKMTAFLEENGFSSLSILHNNCFFYQQYAICGTRGWFFEEETGEAHDKKVLEREVGRLEASLKAAGDREKLCFLHYPPRYGSYVSRPIADTLKKYGVRECYYGHIHGRGHRLAVNGEAEGVEYHLVSADFVNFCPVPVK